MKKILVVDDNEAILDMLKELLESRGFEVQLLSGGNGVQDIVEMRQPDLVLLDLLLGRYNGMEICSRIKQNPYTRTVPVLLMSAMERLPAGQNTPPDGFIAKPFDILCLMTTIDRLAA